LDFAIHSHATVEPRACQSRSQTFLDCAFDNFVLQQNLDLTTTNWTDVTNTSTLNLTNLQDEVILLPTNGNGFYRLKTP
jgi:hypothetical protein